MEGENKQAGDAPPRKNSIPSSEGPEEADKQLEERKREDAKAIFI